MPSSPSSRRATIAGVLVLVVLPVVAGGAWLATTTETRTRLEGANVELVETRRAFADPTSALCVIDGACVQVPAAEEWRVVLDDPIVVRGFWWVELHLEVVLDPATGREISRTDFPTSIAGTASTSAAPVRWHDVVLEAWSQPAGGRIRVFDAHDGVVRHEWALELTSPGDLTAIDETTFRIVDRAHAYELSMPDGPPRDLVPEATSVCITGGLLFSGDDGVLSAATARGADARVVARPGRGEVAGCSTIRDFAVVAWIHEPRGTREDPEVARAIASETSIDAGLAIYVLDASARALLHATAFVGADYANLDTCRFRPGDEAAMGACRGEIGVSLPDRAVPFDVTPTALVPTGR